MNLADALSGSNGSFIKWDMPGESHTGTITDINVRQSTKFGTTEPDTWDNGDAKMQVIVAMATKERDASNEDDDGTRLFSINLWSGQKKALAEAVKKAGIKEPKKGDKITVTYKSGKGNASSPRVYEYVIVPADSGVIQDALDTAEVEEAPAAAAPAANAADTAKQLLAAGIDHETVAASTGLPVAAVAALANTL